MTFCHPNSKATFAKIIAGLPGDRIEIEDGIILIDGIPQGKQSPNSMLSYTPSGIIPEGFFFAIGCCSDSFDSRYALFGLVPITAIKEQLWPIF